MSKRANKSLETDFGLPTSITPVAGKTPVAMVDAVLKQHFCQSVTFKIRENVLINENTGGVPGRHGIPFCPTVFFYCAYNENNTGFGVLRLYYRRNIFVLVKI
jgi:hypothetical protein